MHANQRYPKITVVRLLMVVHTQIANLHLCRCCTILEIHFFVFEQGLLRLASRKRFWRFGRFKFAGDNLVQFVDGPMGHRLLTHDDLAVDGPIVSLKSTWFAAKTANQSASASIVA
jgi:hypothetical protein